MRFTDNIDNSLIKIFVCSHELPVQDDELFVGLQVGANKHPDLNICSFKDNDGNDNISDKNGFYSELSGMYWIWKNAKRYFPQLQYVGMCHYRRWFNFGADYNKVLDLSIFNECSAIAFQRECWWKTDTMRHFFEDEFSSKSIDVIENYIASNQELTFEFKSSFNDLLDKNIQFRSYQNSFVLKWNDFEKLCSIIFDVLFYHDRIVWNNNEQNRVEFIEQLNKTSKTHYHNKFRYDGYFAELIFASFIDSYKRQGLVVKEYEKIDQNYNYDENYIQKYECPKQFLNESVENDYKISTEMKKVWSIELSIYQWIESVCLKHNLLFSGIGGTLLGAIRHNGFIPWDDDIDILMPRESYEKFVFYAKQEQPNNLIVQNMLTDINCNFLHTKIIYKNSTAYNKNKGIIDNYSGVFVNIFPCDKIPIEKEQRNVFIQEIQSKKSDVYNAYKSNMSFSNKLNVYRSFLKYLTQYNENRYEDGFEYANESLMTFDEKFRFGNIDFSNYKYVPFEYSSIRILENSEELLNIQYGNWHKIIKGGQYHDVDTYIPDVCFRSFIKPRYKYSVLTYSFGNYAQIHEIQQKENDIEYVLVTDNPSVRSKTWNVVYEQYLDGLSVFDKCYWVRFHPFNYVHSDIVMRIDGSIGITGKISKIFNEFEKGHYELSLMAHPTRNILSEEYAEWNKNRNYPFLNAFRCLNWCNSLQGEYCKGLYQMCYEIQKNNDINNNLNEDTYNSLKLLGDDGLHIERLDQTVFSAIFNSKYATLLDNKVLWFGENLITNSPFFVWYLHNSNVVRPQKTQYIIPYCNNNPIVLYNLLNLYNSEDLRLNDKVFADYHTEYKSSDDLKCAVVCIAKNENKYIKDWVDYHLNLGFDRIYINDNNDIDGEKIISILKDYIVNNQVVIINRRGEVIKQNSTDFFGIQEICYNETYNLIKNDFDWISFIDIDEYITLENKFNTIKEYLNLSRFNKAQCIKLLWKTYTDNENVYYYDAPVYERFKQWIQFPSVPHTKCIFRTNIDNFHVDGGGHNAKNMNIIISNSTGDLFHNSQIGSIENTFLTHNDCCIRHFWSKSTEEFCRTRIINKVCANFKQDLTQTYIDHYFTVNKRTPEKEALFNKYLAEYKESLEHPEPNPPMTEDNTKFFILGYKNFKCPVHNSKLYSIVDVKSDNAIVDGYVDENGQEYHYDIPIIYTDKKNTISNMNEIYDEWCGIYWLWKNYKWKDIEYIGLCQYRRYFEFLDNPAYEVLTNTDTVLGTSKDQSSNNGIMYQTYHNIDELTKLAQCFAPDDIEPARKFVLSNTFYPSNLVLLSKKQFFDYCAFVFGYIKKYQVNENLYTVDDVINRVKSTIDKYPNRGSEEATIKYQKQLLAFLMERLGNIWIHKQLGKKKVMKVSCIETEHTGQGIFKYKDVQ